MSKMSNFGMFSTNIVASFLSVNSDVAQMLPGCLIRKRGLDHLAAAHGIIYLI